MTKRAALVALIAGQIAGLPRERVMRVAIDGVDGAGKTHFSGELASFLARHGRPVIQASVDAFHAPKAVRYHRGRSSPEGFYRDSYDYPAVICLLLEPLAPGGTLRFKRFAFDHRLNTPIDAPWEKASESAILLFDGIFLHRPELRAFWDYSIFLDVDFSISIPRGAQRGEGSADPSDISNHRYIEGQRIYFAEGRPWDHATVVIDNNSLDGPFITSEAASVTV